MFDAPSLLEAGRVHTAAQRLMGDPEQRCMAVLLATVPPPHTTTTTTTTIVPLSALALAFL